jgi:hypothetical protein
MTEIRQKTHRVCVQPYTPTGKYRTKTDYQKLTAKSKTYQNMAWSNRCGMLPL